MPTTRVQEMLHKNISMMTAFDMVRKNDKLDVRFTKNQWQVGNWNGKKWIPAAGKENIIPHDQKNQRNCISTLFARIIHFLRIIFCGCDYHAKFKATAIKFEKAYTNQENNLKKPPKTVPPSITPVKTPNKPAEAIDTQATPLPEQNPSHETPKLPAVSASSTPIDPLIVSQPVTPKKVILETDEKKEPATPLSESPQKPEIGTPAPVLLSPASTATATPVRKAKMDAATKKVYENNFNFVLKYNDETIGIKNRELYAAWFMDEDEKTNVPKLIEQTFNFIDLEIAIEGFSPTLFNKKLTFISKIKEIIKKHPGDSYAGFREALESKLANFEKSLHIDAFVYLNPIKGYGFDQNGYLLLKDSQKSPLSQAQQIELAERYLKLTLDMTIPLEKQALLLNAGIQLKAYAEAHQYTHLLEKLAEPVKA